MRVRDPDNQAWCAYTCERPRTLFPGIALRTETCRRLDKVPAEGQITDTERIDALERRAWASADYEIALTPTWHYESRIVDGKSAISQQKKMAIFEGKSRIGSDCCEPSLRDAIDALIYKERETLRGGLPALAEGRGEWQISFFLASLPKGETSHEED
jgi:hypothetical protein